MRMRRVDNPPNPYESSHAEWLEPPPPARIEVYEEQARSILSRNESPDLPFEWSVNPYRGCQHACAYCYARTYHEYLGFGAGTDFETRLVAKVNAPELLDAAFRKKSWRRQSVHFSGITDCYQPIEATYELTRRCLEVCLAHANSACIVTKGALVIRDADLLARLNRRAGASVLVSIPFAEAEPCKLLEPQAPPPDRRFEMIRRLREASVPTGVIVSPIVPSLTDHDIPEILERSAAAGATWATFTMLRLPGNVEKVFVRRLAEVMPLRKEKILNGLRAMRGGALNEGRFGCRFYGTGPRWKSIAGLFRIHQQRLGLGEVDQMQPLDCSRCHQTCAQSHVETQLMLDLND
ncbi:MAG: radical SAM protein [Phycisphaerales bacterium]|nr:MAG: radical SAM protein [Phycisphaerales bacterium]